MRPWSSRFLGLAADVAGATLILLAWPAVCVDDTAQTLTFAAGMPLVLVGAVQSPTPRT